MPIKSVAWYDARASHLAASYESIPSVLASDWLSGLLPVQPGLLFDIGSGTGRDAAAFADAGYDVVAIEPSHAMRAEASTLHNSPKIRWLPDSLPGLAVTSKLGLAADVVLLSAVWQHIAPPDRTRAFR